MKWLIGIGIYLIFVIGIGKLLKRNRKLYTTPEEVQNAKSDKKKTS